MNTLAPPRKSRAQRQAAILAGIENGMSDRAAALAVGVNPRTVRRWLQDPAFQAACEAARARLQASLIGKVNVLIDDPATPAHTRLRALELMLSKRFPAEFGDYQRLDIRAGSLAPGECPLDRFFPDGDDTPREYDPKDDILADDPDDRPALDYVVEDARRRLEQDELDRQERARLAEAATPPQTRPLGSMRDGLLYGDITEGPDRPALEAPKRRRKGQTPAYPNGYIPG